MTKLALTYFDFDGGRGEPIRLALHIAGIAFDDVRFAMSEFAEVRKSTPFGQVPTLQLAERQITQTNAILRYVGKQGNLYPTDLEQGLLCDEVMDVIEDKINKAVTTFGLNGDELKAAREALLDGPFTMYVQWLDQRLQQQGGDYFAGDQLSIADLKVSIWLKALMAGFLDHIPTDWVEKQSPALAAYVNRVFAQPKIVEYYQGRQG